MYYGNTIIQVSWLHRKIENQNMYLSIIISLAMHCLISILHDIIIGIIINDIFSW